MKDYAKDSVAAPTVRRLSLYHQYLTDLLSQHKEYISATSIAEHFSYIPILVRKDLASTGCIGKPKKGFPVSLLLRHIEDILGLNSTQSAILIGVGHLGHALLSYSNFHHAGIEITAAFDVSPKVIGTEFFRKKVYSMEECFPYIKKNNIKIAILCVPFEVAQDVAKNIVENGIEAIWNFVPQELQVPPHVIVQNENLAASLAVLSRNYRTLSSYRRVK